MGSSPSKPSWFILGSGICTQLPAWRLTLHFTDSRTQTGRSWDYKGYIALESVFFYTFSALVVIQAWRTFKRYPDGLDWTLLSLAFALLFVFCFTFTGLAWFASDTCRKDSRGTDDKFNSLLTNSDAFAFLAGFAEVILLATLVFGIMPSLTIWRPLSKMLYFVFANLLVITSGLMLACAIQLKISYKPDYGETWKNGEEASVLYVTYAAVYLMTASISFLVSLNLLSNRPTAPQGGIYILSLYIAALYISIIVFSVANICRAALFIAQINTDGGHFALFLLWNTALFVAFVLIFSVRDRLLLVNSAADPNSASNGEAEGIGLGHLRGRAPPQYEA